MKDLIFEYEHGLVDLRKKNRKLKDKKRRWKRLKDKAKDPVKLEIIDKRYAVVEAKVSDSNKMIREMEDDIYNMKTGRRPGSRRGVERSSGSQREYAVDPVRFLHIPEEEKEVRSEEELNMLEDQVEDLLWFLTKPERDIYMLFYGQGFSKQKISEISGIKKGNVSKTLHRARKKVEKNIKKEDFLT